jgi:hypothetical protein
MLVEQARSATTDVNPVAVPTRPEPRLLYLCAGVGENDQAIADLAKSRLDWAYVTRLAFEARALPVVLRRIEGALGGSVPPAARALRNLAVVEEFELRRMEERLDETLVALEAAGIEALLLKGAALARTVYRSVADRPMLDLDLLVPAERVDDARTTALANGWTWRRDAQLDRFYRTHHHLPPFDDARGTRALLELHTGLFPSGHPFGLTAEDMRARAIRVDDGRGRAVMVPAPEDHIVYLCAHWAWSHMMNGGGWRALRDVGALVDRGGIEWDTCVERAREARASTCVYWTLRLASGLSGVSAPESVLDSLRPPTPEPVLARLERHFQWQLGGDRVCPSVKMGATLWSMAFRPRWSAHGHARPWSNPETAAWLQGVHSPPRSAMQWLTQCVGFVAALVRP